MNKEVLNEFYQVSFLDKIIIKKKSYLIGWY